MDVYVSSGRGRLCCEGKENVKNASAEVVPTSHIRRVWSENRATATTQALPSAPIMILGSETHTMISTYASKVPATCSKAPAPLRSSSPEDPIVQTEDEYPLRLGWGSTEDKYDWDKRPR